MAPKSPDDLLQGWSGSLSPSRNHWPPVAASPSPVNASGEQDGRQCEPGTRGGGTSPFRSVPACATRAGTASRERRASCVRAGFQHCRSAAARAPSAGARIR